MVYSTVFHQNGLMSKHRVDRILVKSEPQECRFIMKCIISSNQGVCDKFMEEHAHESGGHWFYKYYAIYVSNLEITVEDYCNLCKDFEYNDERYYYCISKFMEIANPTPKPRRSKRLTKTD